MRSSNKPAKEGIYIVLDRAEDTSFEDGKKRGKKRSLDEASECTKDVGRVTFGTAVEEDSMVEVKTEPEEEPHPKVAKRSDESSRDKNAPIDRAKHSLKVYAVFITCISILYIRGVCLPLFISGVHHSQGHMNIVFIM